MGVSVYENILLENNLPLFCDGQSLYGDFRNMIRFENSLYDEELDGAQKVFIGLMQLFNEVHNDEQRILQNTDILIWFYTMGKGTVHFEKTAPGTYKHTCAKNDAPSHSNKIFAENSHITIAPRIYDFNEDANCIYSSFLQAYNIDLTATDFLHWWKFCALFENLPAHTPMAQKMSYRAMDLSLIKDKQQREFYEKLKREFALKSISKNIARKTAKDIENYNKARVKKRFEAAKNAVKATE